MKIILQKAAEISGKKFHIGQRLDVTKEVFESLGDAAKPYNGPMLTTKRTKTNLFKPKESPVQKPETKNEQ